MCGLRDGLRLVLGSDCAQPFANYPSFDPLLPSPSLGIPPHHISSHPSCTSPIYSHELLHDSTLAGLQDPDIPLCFRFIPLISLHFSKTRQDRPDHVSTEAFQIPISYSYYLLYFTIDSYLRNHSYLTYFPDCSSREIVMRKTQLRFI
jgi:hypothetical protein